MAGPRVNIGGFVLAFAIALYGASALAQTPSPVPGPNNPNPSQPPIARDRTIVINPTIQECRRGWVSGSQWSKDQFDKFCAEIQQSK